MGKGREDIELRNGKLKFDSDLLDLDHGIYLSVYASDGTLLYGKIPYDFDNSVPFQDGEIRKIQGADSEFYLLDMVFEITDYGVVDVRGITSITEAESSFSPDFAIGSDFSSASGACYCFFGILYDRQNASSCKTGDGYGAVYPPRWRFVQKDSSGRRKR